MSLIDPSSSLWPALLAVSAAGLTLLGPTLAQTAFGWKERALMAALLAGSLSLPLPLALLAIVALRGVWQFMSWRSPGRFLSAPAFPAVDAMALAGAVLRFVAHAPPGS